MVMVCRENRIRQGGKKMEDKTKQKTEQDYPARYRAKRFLSRKRFRASKKGMDKLQTDFFFYVWLFFLLSVFGWLWEGFLYLFKDEMYVNRGFLTGPWLPIYGAGGVMLELLFGVGGLLLVWLVSPLFHSLYRRIPRRVQALLGV